VTARAERLDQRWLGRTLSIDMLAEFDRLAVDPCGENGDFYSFVFDGPIFCASVSVLVELNSRGNRLVFTTPSTISVEKSHSCLNELGTSPGGGVTWSRPVPWGSSFPNGPGVI